jgi:uncharacterized protein (TIGR02594 family)
MLAYKEKGQGGKMKITAYQIAERFIGTREIPGKDGADHKIMSMLHIDDEWPQDDSVPWCSAFVNYVAWLLRLPRSKSLMARSWLDVGIPIGRNEAKCGFDVVILKRGGDPRFGHVGFFSSAIGSEIYILGGNQSDSVSVEGYDISRLVGVRRLRR